MFRWTLALAILACGTPLVLALGASGVASALGCKLNEGMVNPCLLSGIDIGGALTTMFVMGWLMLFTLPLAVLLIAIWIIVEIVRAVRMRRAAA